MAIKFGPTAASQIARVVRAYEREDQADGQQNTRSRLLRQPMLECFLRGDLAAATNVLTEPTTAQAVVLRQSDFDSSLPAGDNDLEESSVLIDVVNRSTDLVLVANTYVIVGHLNGEWRILWADCGPSAGGSTGSSGPLFFDAYGDAGYGG